jgi:riboflavin synthase
MFTGIVENIANLISVSNTGTNIDFWFETSLAQEFKIDQSVAHNGVCLTVVEIKGNKYRVTAIEETLKKSNLGDLKTGDIVNIERSMKIGDRVDGHFVYGHVDAIGTCQNIENKNGSWIFTISFPPEFNKLIVEKGSISLNGTSLTVFEVGVSSFKVAIIPFTFEHTSIKKLSTNSKINLEFDIFGKYVEKQFQNR